MAKRRPLFTLDAWEIALLTAFVGFLLWVTWQSAWRAANPYPTQSSFELQAFRDRYGPYHYSEREEEWMIRDYFRIDGTACSSMWAPITIAPASKTYYLESNLGWSGIAIEPQREFAADYGRFRPRTKFFPFFVSDVSNKTARLFVLKAQPLMASSDKEFVKTVR